MFRCEIIIPKSYNDGSRVEPEKIELTWTELLAKFHGVTVNDGKGGWQHLGKIYEEDNHKFTVDTSSIDIEYLRQYKEVLKDRFKQEEIYIITYPITRV